MVKIVKKLGSITVPFGEGYLFSDEAGYGLSSVPFSRGSHVPNIIFGVTPAQMAFPQYDAVATRHFDVVSVHGGSVSQSNAGFVAGRVWQAASAVHAGGTGEVNYQWSQPLTDLSGGALGLTMTERTSDDSLFVNVLNGVGLAGADTYAVLMGFTFSQTTEYVLAAKLVPDLVTAIDLKQAFPVFNAGAFPTPQQHNALVPMSRTDSAHIYFGGKIVSFVSFWESNAFTALDRYVCKWLPSGDATTADSQEVRLEDAADDEAFHRIGAGVGPDFGFLNTPMRVIASNEYGFFITIDYVGDDTIRVTKYFQVDPSFTYYYEIIPQATDSVSTLYLTAAMRYYVQLSVAEDGNLIMAVLPPVASGYAERMLGGQYEQPVWPVAPVVTGSTILRTWTFPLDNHDFFVLRLGKHSTMVYDLSTKQWTPWASGGNEVWAVNTGFEWQGGLGKEDTNIVVGDDTTGNLYFLDTTEIPDQAKVDTDDDIYFDRIATAYLPARGRTVVPCFNIYLSCDMEGYGGSVVTLEYSDDGGRTYVTAGGIVAADGQMANEYAWRSLGQISAPGRMFRITDNGVAQRLDSLEINDGNE
jgi:hypothetical protein